ncbi:GNAT family N-acetyltransferase [Oscillatoria laete-virens NRMC-F 0139]|nr:GNAT family N-acetyltransferase [Oscillatoria laete-virens]MDL5054781.1 GNAT family N-acetyltransferase [Oscillatoria laete-virens NRMC-F 0139]
MSEPVFAAYTPDCRDTFLSLARAFYAHEQMTFDLRTIDRVLNELSCPTPPGFLYLITFQEKAAGYLMVTLCYSMEFGGRFLLLDELFVSEEFRGHGLGKKAVQFAENLCRTHACKHLRLEVARQNHTAMALYQRTGFVSHDRDYLTKVIHPGKI